MNSIFYCARECRAIPTGWARVPVSRLIEKHFCGPSPDCEERQIASDEEWGVLKTTAITWDGWNEKAHKVLPRAYWGRRDIEVKAKDVLVTKAGPRDRVGVVVYVKSEPKQLIVSGKMIGLRLRPDQVLPQVLAGALSLRSSQEYIHARTTGMAESQVNFANDVLLKTEVCIPPLPEQARVAAVLDTIDDAIAKTEAVIAKLKQVRAGVLHDLLTCGLDENGEPRDPIAHPEQFKDSPLGRIPKEWEIRTCESLCREIVVGIVVKPASYYAEHGIPVLRSANVRDDGITLDDLVFISPESNAALSKSILRTGDVVTVRTGYPGTSCVMPDHLDGANCVDLIISRPRKEIVPEYLALWVNSPFGKDQVLRMQGGLAQQHFNVGEMKNLLVAKSNTQEQKETVRRVFQVEALTKREVETCDKLRLLKSGLMSDVLTGRVRVPEDVLDGVDGL